MAKRRSYRAMLKGIRPFTSGFEAGAGFDLRLNEQHLREQLTPQQKARITRYWKEIDRLTARPATVYKSRSDRKLKAAQRASQHDPGFPDLKVAFVPVADMTVPAEVIVDRHDQVKVLQRGVERTLEPFDLETLAVDPESEVARVLDENPDVKRWVIAAGKYEALVFGAMDADVNGISRMISKVQARYSAEHFDPDDRSSHYWGNWLHGLIGYDYGRQRDFQSYQRAKRRSKDKLKKLRRQIKRAKPKRR